MFKKGLYCCCGLDTDYSDYNSFIIYNDILSFKGVGVHQVFNVFLDTIFSGNYTLF